MKTYLSGDPIADRRADYATMLAEAGDAGAAADVMAQALDAAPDWAAGWFRLGGLRETAGSVEQAAEAYREALRLDPADSFGAGLKLALLGTMPVPEAPSPAYVEGLFDQYADRFETALVTRLDYRAPQAMAEALAATAGADAAFARVLDLGCGTGLMGERLRGRASRLVGVDLSEGMIAKAARKGIYDELHHADIAMFGEAAAYDLVTAADVLSYLGDLSAVFAHLRRIAQPGALFAFTTERHDGTEDFILQPSLRYAHSSAYLVRLAETHGFELRQSEALVLRQDRGEPVGGWLMILAVPSLGIAPFEAIIEAASPVSDDLAPSLVQ
ncbi:class I SAM-dependent DNA methyltransferase [Consotaella aegiceratis]|uniref:class I SAM-dependent DNA methyltransferase n=1 Tax=Consotaella aegiceratis TaxID=3097961 RepID=UPI002F42CC6A